MTALKGFAVLLPWMDEFHNECMSKCSRRLTGLFCSWQSWCSLRGEEEKRMKNKKQRQNSIFSNAHSYLLQGYPHIQSNLFQPVAKIGCEPHDLLEAEHVLRPHAMLPLLVHGYAQYALI